MKKKYVIIGGGTASIGCIEGIRSVDKEGDITLISGENHHVYGRPLISYYLEGKTDLERIKYRPDDFYEKNNVSLIFDTAEKIDSEKKTVTLSSGKKVEYTELMVSTGSKPFVPPFEGLDTAPKKFTFLTLDDALTLEKELKPDSKVLIIGAGLIGLKCAEGIKDRVGKITVCDLATRVLSSIFDDECAEIMQKHMESEGIEFLLGDSAVKFEGNTAEMKSGKKIHFDILVIAVGVRPNVELIKEIGGEVDRGIKVNEKMQTSLKNIYSAGDCSEGYDMSIDADRILAILPNAYIGAKCGGINMAGGEASVEDAIPMNSIGFFGLHAMSAGSYEGEEYKEKTEKSIKKLFVKDGLLKGFIIIGDTKGTGIYTSLIRNKTQLSQLDFEAVKKNPSLAAFSQEYRKEKLGGVV